MRALICSSSFLGFSPSFFSALLFFILCSIICVAWQRLILCLWFWIFGSNLLSFLCLIFCICQCYVLHGYFLTCLTHSVHVCCYFCVLFHLQLLPILLPSKSSLVCQGCFSSVVLICIDYDCKCRDELHSSSVYSKGSIGVFTANGTCSYVPAAHISLPLVLLPFCRFFQRSSDRSTHFRTCTMLHFHSSFLIFCISLLV